MNLVDHVSCTCTDLDRSRAFYDAIMQALGVERVVDDGKRIGYGRRCRPGDEQHSYFSVFLSPRSVTPERKRHIAFKASDRAAVERFFRAGLAAGGRGDLEPALRPEYHEAYYSAFLSDPDGNRLEAVCHGRP